MFNDFPLIERTEWLINYKIFNALICRIKMIRNTKTVEPKKKKITYKGRMQPASHLGQFSLIYHLINWIKINSVSKQFNEGPSIAVIKINALRFNSFNLYLFRLRCWKKKKLILKIYPRFHARGVVFFFFFK